MAEFTYNSYKNQSTNLSPFFVNYRFEPDLPSTMSIAEVSGNMTAKDCTCQVQNTVKAVHENLAEAQEKSAKYYDMGRTEATFKPGQKVLISQQLMVP
ncbi:hypothetical protein LPJ79_004074, partial [Coemansia sp. RSA 1821]